MTGSLKELQIHESHCGKQAECCPHCGQFIRLQVLAQHKEVCEGRQAQLGKGEYQGKPGEEEGSFEGQSLPGRDARNWMPSMAQRRRGLPVCISVRLLF